MDVTDIIRDRMAPPAGLEKMITASLVAHAVLGAILVLAPTNLFGRRADEPRTVMNIVIGGAGEGPPNGGRNPAAAPPVQAPPSPVEPAKPGFEIEVAKTPSENPAEGTKPAEQPIGPLLASANADQGHTAARVCETCHTFEKGGPNRVGPNLWGVVDRPKASEAGFNYSAAMKAAGGKWTFDELNKFLTNPRQDIPGTAMTFAGINRDRQRADVVAYLRTLSDNPVQLPR